jgi:hypothetical protein
MEPCAICSEPRRWLAWTCAQSHPDVCHACASMNLREGHDLRPHQAPRVGALTPWEEEALARFQAHMARVEGADAG